MDQTLRLLDLTAVTGAAITSAQGRGVAISVAVVDDGGHLLGFARMDGAHTATVEVSQAKARSAAAFRRPTRVFAEQLGGGNISILAVPGCLPLPGGIPITVGGKIVGAIGVSGAAPDIDEGIAILAANTVDLISPAAG